MKRFLIIFLLILISILALGVASLLVVRAQGPSWLREKIVSSLTKSCPKCKAELESVEVSILEGRLILRGFEFIDTPAHASQVAVKAKKIEIEFDPKEYLNGLILINRVRADGVDFTLTEDPKIKSPDDDSTPLSGLPAMVIRSTEVDGSSFRYVHKVSPHEAVLLLTKVHGSVGSWVTRANLVKKYAPNRTPISAWGELQGLGTFEVQSEADPLSKKGTLQIHVAVKNQPLAAVNGFFLPESGLKFKGQVTEVIANLGMKNGEIDGSLRASYSGLSIKVENKNNSGVKNFLETVGAKIVINGEQGVNGKAEGEKEFHDRRTADQSLFKAIFHSLGGAAKELVR